MTVLQGMSRVDEELLALQNAKIAQKDQHDEHYIQQTDRPISVNEHVLLPNEQNQSVRFEEPVVLQRICANVEFFQQELVQMKREELQQNEAFFNIMSELLQQVKK